MMELSSLDRSPSFPPKAEGASTHDVHALIFWASFRLFGGSGQEHPAVGGQAFFSATKIQDIARY
jgi:hypothetical protein